MKAVRGVVEFLSSGGVDFVFGIPAGSVNAFFDELYTMPQMTPVIVKHEGAASYMAAAYTKFSGKLGVCIGCSGPGSANLLTGAANAMREQLPVLFLTGAVPTSTVGLNASQELDAEAIFRPVTKYSITVRRAEDLVKEVARAVEIALAGVPGPVHVAMPIDVQLAKIGEVLCPEFPARNKSYPAREKIQNAAKELVKHATGYIFAGQGARNAVSELEEIAQLLSWPIVITPQAKGLLPDFHPLNRGIFGFAGHEEATELINEGAGQCLLIVGSSLGETATNNYNYKLTAGRTVIQIDHDPSVFDRKYKVDYPILGDVQESLRMLAGELKELGLKEQAYLIAPDRPANKNTPEDVYNTQNVLLTLQKYLPSSIRYNIDIGEFMSYVIHYMQAVESHTFNINVHFGAMGTGISSAIGMSLADLSKPVACITGDGCFFMHGMEVLTAKEYNLPILFIVMNNARLGMVYHGHVLQYKRAHPRFEQEPVNISNMAEAMGIPSLRVQKWEDLKEKPIKDLIRKDGPAILEVALVDNNIPPMGDRVKFLSSFGK